MGKSVTEKRFYHNFFANAAFLKLFTGNREQMWNLIEKKKFLKNEVAQLQNFKNFKISKNANFWPLKNRLTWGSEHMAGKNFFPQTHSIRLKTLHLSVLCAPKMKNVLKIVIYVKFQIFQKIWPKIYNSSAKINIPS